MTTPQQPPPQQPSGLDNPALPLAVATVLVTATSAAVAMETLKTSYTLSAFGAAALAAVLSDVMSHPPAVTGVIGPASAATGRVNAARRAQYVIAAAKRVLGAARDARSRNQPVTDAISAQLARERRFYAQHQAAMWNRSRAAGQVDMAAAEHGLLLGWNTVLNRRTSAECRAADGKVFRADRMPKIGYPGAVHPFAGVSQDRQSRVRQCSRYDANIMPKMKHCLKCDQDKPVYPVAQFAMPAEASGGAA